MFPERLENDPHYIFTVSETFRAPLSMIYGFVEYNYSRNMHCQEFYEINIVLGGHGKHYVGERSITVDKGDVFIIPPALKHGYKGTVGFDVYHLIISPVFFEKHSADLMLLPAFSSLFKAEPAMRGHFPSDLHLKLSEAALSDITPLLESIRRHSYKNDPADLIITMSEAMILTAKLCSYFSEALENNQHTEVSDRDRAFMESISYIYEKCGDKITVDTLAKIAKMSRSSYISKFKSFTGLSPGEFIIAHRIDTAAKMLISTAQSVSEIAASTGFYDTAHFIHTFTSRMGIPPLEYRHTGKV